METVFEIGEKVKIIGNGATGEVRGVWHSKTGRTQYDVRYFDSTGRHCDGWFLSDEIVLI